MRLKAGRTAIYVAMGLTVLALIGGFTLASLTLGSAPTQGQQGSHTTSIGPVTGLTWVSTTVVVLANPASDLECLQGSPCNVGTGTVTPAACAGGEPGLQCDPGDFAENVTLATTAGAPFSGTLEITLYVTNATNGQIYTGTTFYYTDSPGTAAADIWQVFDIGTSFHGPNPVSAVTVVVTSSG